jgi:hypothetical protein
MCIPRTRHAGGAPPAASRQPPPLQAPFPSPTPAVRAGSVLDPRLYPRTGSALCGSRVGVGHIVWVWVWVWVWGVGAGAGGVGHGHGHGHGRTEDPLLVDGRVSNLALDARHPRRTPCAISLLQLRRLVGEQEACAFSHGGYCLGHSHLEILVLPVFFVPALLVLPVTVLVDIQSSV